MLRSKHHQPSKKAGFSRYQVVPEPPGPGNGCFGRRPRDAVRCCRAKRALVGQCPRNRLVEAAHFDKLIGS